MANSTNPIGWTQADIDTLKAAVGSGVLSVSYSGPPARTVTYQSLSAMRGLLAEMVRAVEGNATYRLAATSKGLSGGTGPVGSSPWWPWWPW